MYHIGTDGASRGNPGPASWAFAVFDQDNKYLGHKSEAFKSSTNNKMELLAIVKSLDWLSRAKDSSATIYTDSNFAYKGLTEWFDGWMKRGGKNSKGQAVAHWDLFMQAHQLMNIMSVRLVKVKGHSGHRFNEAADKACNVALDTKKLID